MPLDSVLTDEELVVVVRETDTERYGELIRRYQTKLTHYLRKFIRDYDALEDVLQDVFIKAYRNLYNFNIARKFSPWIYRIAHNEALNALKKYRLESVSLDETEWDWIDENMDTAAGIKHIQLKGTIETGLAKLKIKYREPLILYFFEQKTYEEISDILHLPTSTVGTRIARGKKLLQVFINSVYGKS